MTTFRKLMIGSTAVAMMAGAGMVPAHSEPVAGITASCAYTGPGFAVCAGIGVALHELVQMGNGKDGFGPNGEIMKVIAVPVKIIDRNIKAAEHESGEIDKVVRATTGISIKDIKKYGAFGGPNSFFRKPFG